MDLDRQKSERTYDGQVTTPSSPSVPTPAPDDVAHPRPRRVAIAPDSFKGSASALAIAQAMARGVREASTAVDVDIRLTPMADGGEGTLDALLDAWAVPDRTCETIDALGRATTARYGLSPEGVGVLEAAESSGLPKVSDRQLAPLAAHTYGVGQIALALLDDGCTEILLCVGGSATTDGGTGLLTALGARFLDDGGAPVPLGGGGLAQIHRIDLSGLDPRARSVRWRVACDVTNPLVGPAGAAAVFGPQKGATPQQVALLDAGLNRLADVVAAEMGIEVRDTPGMGAAGGIATLLVALFNAELVAGSALVAQTIGLREVLAGADLILTGEGRFDDQSLHGKVVDAVVANAPEGVPVVVIAGEVSVSAQAMGEHGVSAAFAAARGPRTLEQLGESVHDDVAYTAAMMTRLLGL